MPQKWKCQVQRSWGRRQLVESRKCEEAIVLMGAGEETVPEVGLMG